jgi:hypothetical protein
MGNVDSLVKKISLGQLSTFNACVVDGVPLVGIKMFPERLDQTIRPRNVRLNRSIVLVMVSEWTILVRTFNRVSGSWEVDRR